MRLGINATILDVRPSGLGVYTARVAHELARHEPGLLVYATTAAGLDVPRSAVRNVWGRTRPSLGARGHLARLAWTHTALPRRLARDGRSVVLTTCPEPMWRSPVPQVCVVHDLIALRFPAYFPRLRWYFAHVLPALVRRCAAVIADSETTRRDVVALLGVPDAAVRVVAPGHDRERFRVGLDPEPVKRRYGLQRYVLYVGNLLPHKNVAGLVRAFAAVAPRCPHQLVLAGHLDPRFAGHLAAEIEARGLAGRVVTLHYVAADDLPALYAGAELYVQPSLYEGFGLPLLEAMACGTPVVSARGGSLPEVGGDAALWVDPGDVDGLSAAIERALSDAPLRAALREQGVARARTFTWEATGRGVFDVLKSLGTHDPSP